MNNFSSNTSGRLRAAAGATPAFSVGNGSSKAKEQKGGRKFKEKQTHTKKIKMMRREKRKPGEEKIKEKIERGKEKKKNARR